MVKVALASYDIIWESPEKNRDLVDDLLDNDREKAELYILPEMFNSGFSMQPEGFAEQMNGPTIAWMKDKADRLDTAICGSLAIRSGDSFVNRFVFIYPGGDVKYYDKRHLFGYSGEDKKFLPGSERVVVEYKQWKILLQICYDLRFPVFSRNKKDYDLVIYVANWPSPRAAHWRSLLKARAIENQSYVIGVNRIGKDGNGLQYAGDSQVYKYDGECLTESRGDQGLFKAQLDLEGLTTYRSSFPFLNDADDFTLKS
jgi:predicted amidohydrolase